MAFRILAVVVLVAALVAGFWFGDRIRDREPPQTGAIILTEPRDPGAFQLTDHRGQPFSPAELANRWTLWFFGFTHCPDVCPMTLHTLDLVDGILATEGGVRPEVLMVSVDPARDTPERLAEYIPYFNESFTGVTGTAGTIRELTERLGIIVQYVAQEGDDYTVDHSAQLLLTGPDGMVYAVFPSPHEPGALAHDLQRLIPWLGERK
jgi:protein SCO1